MMKNKLQRIYIIKLPISVNSLIRQFTNKENSGNWGAFSPESPMDMSERSDLINRNIHKATQSSKLSIDNYRILLLIFNLIIIINLFSFSSADSAYGPIIKTESYEVSRSYVIREISVGDIFRDSFIIKNLKDQQIKIYIIPSEEISDVITLESSGELIDQKNYTSVFFTISGREARIYSGNIEISGDIKD